jgi:WD40 repeat protein/Mrp family chromosome partitioning ATPase
VIAASGQTDPVLPGRVITFYSYKGGTGRSMALANVAVLLASLADRPRPTLMVDWDLEAPGLHKYFPLRADMGPMADPVRPGLVDLFAGLFTAARELAPLDELERRARVVALVDSLDLDQYIAATDVPNLHLLKAGRFDHLYSDLVNRFRWDEFYDWAPWAFRALTERLIERYAFVLVDSRTGLTDTSSICTALLPDKLVVVFTPNEQSLEGVRGLVERTIAHRYESDDLRPLIIYPLPSRIEESEPAERDAWRLGSEGRKLAGWQRLFERTLEQAYDIPSCDLSEYFDQVQIRHHPYYAYGEKIAVRLDRGTEVTALPRIYGRFVEWLANRASPWESERDARDREAKALGRRVDGVYSALGVEEQQQAKRLFTRLVNILGEREVGDFSLRIAKIADFAPNVPAMLPVIAAFEQHGVLVVERTSAGDAANGGIVSVRLREKSLVSAWARLREWLDDDRTFLLWRQRLDHQVEGWLEYDRDPSLLLRATSLEESVKWWSSRADDFSSIEREFIDASRHQESVPSDRPSLVPHDLLSAIASDATTASVRRSLRFAWGAFAAAAVAIAIVVAVARPGSHTTSHAGLIVTAAGLSNDPAQSALLLATLDDKDGPVALDRARQVARNRLPVAVYPIPGSIVSAAVNSQGTYVVVVTANGNAYLRTIAAEGGRLVSLPVHDATSGSFSPDGQTLLIAGRNGHLTVLRGDSTSTVVPVDSSTVGVALLSSQRLLAVSRGGGFTIWNGTGCCRWTSVPVKSHAPRTRGATFSANATTLALDVQGPEGLQLWDTRTMSAPIFTQRVSPRSMALSRDGTSVAVLSQDSVVSAWDLIGPIILQHRTTLATGIAIDPHGDHVAVATASGRALVFQTTRHGTSATPAGAVVTGDSIELRTVGSVSALAFADSSTLVTASDSTLRVWRLDRALPSPTASWPELRAYFASATSGCLTAQDRQTILAENEATARDAFRGCATRYGIMPETSTVVARADSAATGGARDTVVRALQRTATTIDLAPLMRGEDSWTGEWVRPDGTTMPISLVLTFSGNLANGRVRWGASPQQQNQKSSRLPSGDSEVSGSIDSRRFEIQLHASNPHEGEPASYRLLIIDRQFHLLGTILTADSVRSTVRASLSGPAAAR